MFSSSASSSSSTAAAWSAHHQHLIRGNCITALECTKLAALSSNLDGKLDPELGTGFFCIKFVSPFHTRVIWRWIKKFKSEWKLVLGGPGTQLSKKIWSWAQNYPHTIIALDPLGEQPWLRTLQKTNVRGNDWSRVSLMICLATVATSWHRYRADSLARPQMSGSGKSKIPNE